MDDIILQNRDGQILASSLDIADKFGKSHNHVVRDIQNIISKIDCPKVGSEMFMESTYKNTRGKIYKSYLMNRDGFTLLVMGFTGKAALEWKIKYINAFNQMEERLTEKGSLSEENKLKLLLFSDDPLEVTSARKKLLEAGK